MSFSVEGVLEFDAHLCASRAGEVIGWLREGLHAIDQNSPDQLYDCFRPLVINPDRDPLAQLGTAFREAEAVGLHGTARTRRIIRNHLERSDVLRLCTYAEVTRFWQILASMRCEADLHGTARTFIRNALCIRSLRRDANGDREQALRRIGEAMVSAVVASRPLSGAQLSFLRHVKKLPSFWSTRLVGLVVDCEFEVALALEIEDPIATWDGLLRHYGTDLQTEADPSTPAGRALLRSIARRVRLPTPHDPGSIWATLFDEDRRPGTDSYVEFEKSKALELN